MTLPTIYPGAHVDASAKIWSGAIIRENSVVGENCVIGSSAYIDQGVTIGNNCKIQNLAQIFSPATLEDGVFIGPGVVLTNDKNPRAMTPEGLLKVSADWSAVGVQVQKGASIGAGSICVAPLRIGTWSLIAAGSVVVKNVENFELVGGNPARHLGWVGRAGFKLVQESQTAFKCPQTGERYFLSESDGLKPEVQND
jgi:acetyltransferase-like isoleucine patch superfamily enzyme